MNPITATVNSEIFKEKRNHKDYADSLLTVGNELCKTANTLPGKIKDIFIKQAELTFIQSECVRNDPKIGPITFTLRMLEIQKLADFYLGNIQSKRDPTEQKEPSKPSLFELVKEFRKILFYSLQWMGLVDIRDRFVEIPGNEVETMTKHLRECNFYVRSLPKEQFAAQIKEWDNLGGKIRNNSEPMIRAMISIIEALPEKKILPEHVEQIKKAIQEGKDASITNLMMLFPVDQLNESEKMEIARLAVDEESTNSLLAISEFDWFIDLMEERCEELISYARTSNRKLHIEILEGLPLYPDFNEV